MVMIQESNTCHPVIHVYTLENNEMSSDHLTFLDLSHTVYENTKSQSPTTTWIRLFWYPTVHPSPITSLLFHQHIHSHTLPSTHQPSHIPHLTNTQNDSHPPRLVYNRPRTSRTRDGHPNVSWMFPSILLPSPVPHTQRL